VTRKTQLVVAGAVALTGLAVVTALWLTQGNVPPPDDTPSQAHTTPPAPDLVKDAPIDPQAMADVREAFQKSMAEGAPPGMLELMQGSSAGKSGTSDLPPLSPPDPLVTPVKYSSSPSADLPPLPPAGAAPPKLLPPPDESPAAAKKPKEAPASDLPPLPSAGSPR
jgi:hypothetical protein